MEKTPRVAAVIVTYNRLRQLKDCIRAVETQTLPPDMIFIVNNASTDSTAQYLHDRVNVIPTTIINMTRNEGGAGGFAKGIQTAHDTGLYDGYWVMDDDGIPDTDCLKKLMAHFGESEFLAPIVLSIEDSERLAFTNEWTYTQVKNKFKKGYMRCWANPFNGVFFSQKAVQIAGVPKKEMFIWGDEVEYANRLKSYGIQPITYTDAIHKHPYDRMDKHNDIFGRKCIIYVESKLRRYCHARNMTYNTCRYVSHRKAFMTYLLYATYYIFQRKLDLNGLRIFTRGFVHGWRADFTHHQEYLK